MSEEQEIQNREEENPELNYEPPPMKTLTEIVQADKDDESLRKYKETLLGNAAENAVIVDNAKPGRVIVKYLSLLVDGRPSLVLDLSDDLETLKKTTFKIKEGIQYKIKIDFFVQREIVTGMKYVQRVHRKGIQVDKIQLMIGSYAPKQELQSFISPVEEMPSGMISRGTYTVKSLFTDDDKNEHLKWEWSFDLKKDWEE